jgi:hypothetical protein
MSDKNSEYEEITPELQAALKSIIDEFELDERAVRERQIRTWKKLEYYWAGFTRLWWDDTAHDWRIFDDGYGYETNNMGYYDKPINVFRPYMESIIAALSSTVPAIKCSPDDADNPSDILTARGGTKIAELIYKHNDAPLLWCKALFVYCTQGMIAAYNYTEDSHKFGSVDVPDYKHSEESVDTKVCPFCKSELTDQDIEASLSLQLLEADEFDPDDEDAPLHAGYEAEKLICPQCAIAVDPEIVQNKIVVSKFVGVTNQAKSRQIIEVNGGLFVKVPNWARKQSDCPYLGYSYETHYTNILAKYPWLVDELHNIEGTASTDGNELYDRWGRLSPQYYGEYPRSTPTVRNWWLRPSSYHVIKDEKIRKELEETFPDGVHCVWVNDIFACAENESLDDHWTLTYNPLSEYIHFDPLGLLAVSVQDITQDLTSLTLQTIEHGVPQVFADPAVLNFDAYGKTEVVPGSVYPAKPKSGKSLGDAFHMISTATLSAEVMPFGEQIQSLGQFSTGALPSLFGGEQGGSSRTAAQYSMSRNQALQRLQTTWKMINYWWSDVFGKVIPAYIKTMLEDERLVKQMTTDSFINVCIKKSELDGKLGNIEVESADNLPATWGQVRDTVMEMINSGNPAFMESLMSSENIGLLQDVIGLSQFKVPGEGDRVKQFEEIQLLMKSTPSMDMNPQTMMPEEIPSIQPEFEVDNHKIEADVCRSWLVGEAGRQAKIDNPAGYKNVLLHMKMHIQMFQALQGMTAGQGQPSNSEQNKDNKEKPASADSKPQPAQPKKNPMRLVEKAN